MKQGSLEAWEAVMTALACVALSGQMGHFGDVWVALCDAVGRAHANRLWDRGSFDSDEAFYTYLHGRCTDERQKVFEAREAYYRKFSDYGKRATAKEYHHEV